MFNQDKANKTFLISWCWQSRLTLKALNKTIKFNLEAHAHFAVDTRQLVSLFYIYLKASAKIVLSPAEEAAAGFTDFNI